MNIRTALVAALSLMATPSLAAEEKNAGAKPQLTREDVRAVAPALDAYTQERVLGDVWKRPGLSPRDRSIVTLAALITRNQTIEMPYYLNLALDNGVKPAEISEIVTHLAFYAGRGNALAALAVIKDVFAERKITAGQLPAVSPTLLALNEAAEADRARRVGDLFGASVPGVTQYTTDVLFRDLWLRPDLAPRDRRGGGGPAAALRSASRALQRLGTDPQAAPALLALEQAEAALAEAETLLARLAHTADADPRLLERAEERLFALRAAARKHSTTVAGLPELLAGLNARLAALETGEAEIDALAAAAAAARAGYVAACAELSAARREAAKRLDRAVAQELPPLKLERARFVTDLATLDEAAWGPLGADAVRFLIATNPGQEPGPLGKVASGGELSRLLLALKVVLAGSSPVPTLVFDEVDSGVGGATAAAVGERLARVAERVQVLLVTHSPQVAARGAAHLRVAKSSGKNRAETRVEPLDGGARREEIARMLAGETVTEAARAAADSLLGAA